MLFFIIYKNVNKDDSNMTYYDDDGFFYLHIGTIIVLLKLVTIIQDTEIQRDV